MFRDPALTASLAANTLVSTLLMATLVVGPFYLSRGLLLDAAGVGLALSVGPVFAALGGVPAGRLADRIGAASDDDRSRRDRGRRLSPCAALASAGRLSCRIVIVTLGYALFQTANNASAMACASPEERGVVSGMLNLSRNLGLITGASLMGTIFALAAACEVATADPGAVATGMRITFAVAAGLIGAALVIARRGR